MSILHSVLIFVATFYSLQISAQSSWKELTSAELVLETSGVPKDDPFEIGFLIQLKPGWHTYWSNAGHSGSAPRFDWQGDDSLIGTPQFPTPKVFDESGIVTFGFDQKVLIVFPHKGLSESRKIKVSAEWLVCKHICLPAIADFEIDVQVLPVEEITPTRFRKDFEEARRRWPLPIKGEVKLIGSEAHYSIPLKAAPKSFSFFPHKNLAYKKLLPTDHNYADGRFHWTMVTDKSSTDLKDLLGMVSFEHGTHRQSFELDLGVGLSAGSSDLSLFWAFIFAFIGGVILNLMPCVFPILSMKLFSVLKSSGGDLRKMRVENLSYVAGVLVSFLSLGVGLLMIRQAGVQVGWGFQLQSPLFVGSLILLFVILALEMFGFFTFDLIDPSKGHALTRKEGFWGSFFTGVLAVIVASPCSAPFMGAAVGAALTQKGWVTPFIFLTLGLGLAFPYIVLAIRPQLLKWIPRPGQWMNILKELMAFPLLLTAVWLLWIFSQLVSSDEIVVLGIILIGFVFSIWFSSYSRRWAWIFAALVLIAWGAHHLRPQSISSSHRKWIPYSETQVNDRKPGEVMFVNMTADWCITCKVNERLIFETEDVRKSLEDLNITLVKGDWTRRDPVITEFLDRFSRAGVPFYVIFSDKHPRGEVLNEVLTKESFLNKIKGHLSDQSSKEKN